jgi:hypothetical protein
MKKVAIFALVVVFALGFFIIPSYSQDIMESPNYWATGKGDAMLFDIILLRPLGLAAMGVGFAATIVALPFSIIGGNQREVGEALLGEPTAFTFCRPMGEVFPKTASLDY